MPMKRLAKYVVLLLLPLFVVACGGREIDSKLDIAEAVMSERPDSALTILRTIDADKLYSPSRKARYSLVLSETYYYQALPIDNDSLTRVAYDYYISNKNSQIRARAMYQHAMVMYTSNEMAESMVALLEAEKDFNYFDNNRLKGLIETLKGDIYSANIIFEEALESYTRALQYYECTNLDYHLQYALFDKAQMLLGLNRFEEVESILLGVIDECVEQDYKGLLCNAIHCLCDLYIRCEKYEKCSDALKLFDKYKCLEFHHSHYYLLMALVESTRNNRSLALEYLENSDQYENTYFEEVEYIKGRVYENIGLLEDSNYWFKRHKEQQDSLFLDILSLPVLNTEIDLLESSVENANLKLNIVHRRLYTGIVVIILVAIVVAFLIYNRNQRREKKIEQLNDLIEQLRQSELLANDKYIDAVDRVERQNGELSMIQRALQTQFSKQLEYIDSLLEAYYSDVTKGVKRNEIIKSIDDYIDTFSSSDNGYLAVERLVNELHNDIMKSLRCEILDMSEIEYRIICMYYANFSTSSICMLLSFDKNRLYKTKHRLKHKIENSGAPSRQRFLARL